MHRAGSAQRLAAAELCAYELEFIAQNPQERHVGIDIHAHLFAIDSEIESHTAPPWLHAP
jgi:hypothetical protein